MGRTFNHLACHKEAQPTWDREYINYRGMKRLIKSFRERSSKAMYDLERNFSMDNISATDLRNLDGQIQAAEEDPLLDPAYGTESREFTAFASAFRERLMRECTKAANFYVAKAEEYEAFLEQRRESWSQAKDSKAMKSVRHFLMCLRHLSRFIDVNELCLVQLHAKADSALKQGGSVLPSIEYFQDVLRRHESKARSIASMIKETQSILVENTPKQRQESVRKNLEKTTEYRGRKRVTEVFFFGWLVGTIPPFIALVEYLNHTREVTSVFSMQIPVLRFYVAATLCLFLWSANLFVFEKRNINHAFILNLSQVDCLTSFHMCVIACIATVITLFGLLLMIIWPDVVTLCLVPLVLMVVCMAMPRRLWPNARRAFMVSVVNVLILPFGPVRFREFWLADQFTSWGQMFVDFLYTVGMFAYPFTTRVSPNDFPFWGKDFVYIVPYFWRFQQCLKNYSRCRRLKRPKNIHLMNAGKYFSLLFASVIDFLVIHFGMPPMYFIAFKTWAQGYAFCWDVLIDWGFIVGLHKRERIVCESLVPYCILFLYNFIFRFSFLIVLINLGPLNVYSGLIIGFGEILRRFVWNVFRIENEMRLNLESYRTNEFVPDPVCDVGSEVVNWTLER